MFQSKDLKSHISKLVEALQPTHDTARSVCASVGIDVEGAERAAERLRELNGAVLPWEFSPKVVASDVLEVLKISMDGALNEFDAADRLEQEAWLCQAWSLLSATIALTSSQWDNIAKRAFLLQVSGSPLTRFEDFLEGESVEGKRECFHAMMAWVVYNVAARPVLDRSLPSDQARLALEALVAYELSGLARAYHEDLQTGEFPDGHPLALLEDALMALGRSTPELRAGVGATLSAWSEALREQQGPPDASLVLSDALEVLLPASVQAPSLRGEEIGQSARARAEAFQADLAFTKHLEGLINRDEWSDPIGAAQDIASQDLIRLSILQGLYANSAVEVVRQILSGAKGNPAFVLTSSELGLASVDSVSIAGIVEGLRDFVSTGRRTFAEHAGVAEQHMPQLDRVISLLDTVRHVVGPKNIYIITDSALADFLKDRPASNGVIVGPSSLRRSLDCIDVNLEPYSWPDENSMEQLRERVADDTLPGLCRLTTFRAAVQKFVVPVLAELHGGADALGLVGWDPYVALDLAEKIKAFPVLERSQAAFWPRLYIQATVRNDNDDVLEPEAEPSVGLRG